MSDWKLVPATPETITDDMRQAAINYWTSLNPNKLIPIGEINGIIYSALSAAPSPPATAKDGMSEREKKLVDTAREVFGGTGIRPYALELLQEALAAYEEKEEG